MSDDIIDALILKATEINDTLDKIYAEIYADIDESDIADQNNDQYQPRPFEREDCISRIKNPENKQTGVYTSNIEDLDSINSSDKCLFKRKHNA